MVDNMVGGLLVSDSGIMVVAASMIIAHLVRNFCISSPSHLT